MSNLTHVKITLQDVVSTGCVLYRGTKWMGKGALDGAWVSTHKIKINGWIIMFIYYWSIWDTNGYSFITLRFLFINQS
jgi:hypothetical protein